jgi:hypothetical protein
VDENALRACIRAELARRRGGGGNGAASRGGRTLGGALEQCALGSGRRGRGAKKPTKYFAPLASPRLSTCSLLNADDSTPAHVVRARRALAVSVADVPLPGLVVHFDADVPQLALEQVRLIKVRGRARARARAGVLGLGLVLVLVQKVRLIKVARSLRGQPPAQELVDPVQLLGAQLIVVRLRSGVVVQLAAIELSPPRDPA